ncbi:MAG: DEAD/DEAH box helicase [Opitutales bacterium]|nr:DEAD/DEAH box helicase [Opitutales bacterium]
MSEEGFPSASEAFAELKPNIIFSMADAQRIQRGLAYARTEAILDFEWTGRTGILKAKVKGGRTYTVEIRPRGNRIAHRCTCPDWTNGAACKHVIAATAGYFWAERGCSYLPDDPRERARLAAMIRGEPAGGEPLASEAPARPKPRAPETPVEEESRPPAFPAEAPKSPPSRAALPRLFLCFHPDDTEDKFFRGYSTRGAQVIENIYDFRVREVQSRLRQYDDPFDALRAYLNQKHPPMPIMARLRGDRFVPIQQVSERIVTMSLNLLKQKYTVEIGMEVESPPGDSRWEALTPDCVITADGTLISFVLPPLGAIYRDARSIEAFLQRKPPPSTDDNELASATSCHGVYTFNTLLSACMLGGDIEAFPLPETRVDGLPHKPTPGEFPLALVVEPAREYDTTGMYQMSVAILQPDGQPSPLPVMPYALWMHIFQLRRPYFPAQTLEENDDLVRAIQLFLAAPDSERTRLREEFVEAQPTRRRGDSIFSLFYRLGEETALRQFHGLIADSRPASTAPWQTCTLPLGKVLAVALSIVHTHPEKNPDAYFTHAPIETVDQAPADRVEAALPAIFESLDAIGVTLLFRGKPLRPAELQLTFNVNRKRERRDWLEIRPEIVYEGEPLPPAELERAIESGYVFKGDQFIILNSASRDRLEKARKLLRQNAGENDALSEIPRLAIFEFLELRKQGVRLNLPPEDAHVISSLAQFTEIPAVPLPPTIQAEPRSYQSEGYAWLAFLYTHRLGACLADDMGLGKTLQTILFLTALKDGTLAKRPDAGDGPHLLVVPASLVFNWIAEFEKFSPTMRVLDFTGNQRKHTFEGHDVIITTYETLRRDLESFSETSFHTLILDEAQAVKNAKAARTKAVARVEAAFRITLTGTPVENHFGELQTILHLSLPGLFDGIPVKERKGVHFEEKILTRARPFILRRTKDAVLSQLPPKTETTIHLELNNRQKALYRDVAQKVRDEVATAFAEMPTQQAGVIALTSLLRLRQICVSPALYDHRQDPNSPKIAYVAETVSELIDEGHSVLIFSQFAGCLDILMATLEAKKINLFRLDGSTPMKKRKTYVNEFQSAEKASAFLISLRAGGMGLNLTRASYVIHVDPWWNPAVENQASDRAHRIGQTRSVLIQRLVMRHTVEEKISQLKEEKRAIYDRVFDQSPGSGRSGGLTRDDFAFLLDLDD